MQSPINSRNTSRQASLKKVPDDSVSGDEDFTAFALSRLRERFNPALRSVRIEAIKQSATPATVYRLTVDNGLNAARYPSTLIAKRIAPDWHDDPQGHRREVAFYQDWSGSLGDSIPTVYFAGSEPAGDYGLILLEDVAATHRFHAPDHLWQTDELRRALRGYAQLHVLGYNITAGQPAPAWLFPRYETRVIERASKLPEMIDSLVAAEVCPPLRGIEQLIERTVSAIQTWAERPITVVHNDVAPQNIGLRQGVTGKPDVFLVDWEMVGWGLPEMDLAYLFMQPFGNARNLDREQILDAYWLERKSLEGKLPSREDRAARQRHADAVLALWLIPVAYERYRRPFPPGSMPRVYWDSMFTVLGDRLRALTST